MESKYCLIISGCIYCMVPSSNKVDLGHENFEILSSLRAYSFCKFSACIKDKKSQSSYLLLDLTLILRLI